MQFGRLSVVARLHLGFCLILLAVTAIAIVIAISKVHVINDVLRENSEINASI